MMTNKPTSLRFLLSLGNTKIVVLEDQDNLHIYANPTDKSAPKSTVAAARVSEALLTK